MSPTDQPEYERCDGAKVWIVTAATDEQSAWLAALGEALRKRGAESVDEMGVSGWIAPTARQLWEEGSERLARLLRVVRRGGVEAPAVTAAAELRPDLLVIDEPQVARAVAAVRDVTNPNGFCVALVRDFLPADAWAGTAFDAIVVPDLHQITTLRMRGLADERLAVAGPPLSYEPAPEGLRDEVRAEIGAEDGAVCFVDVEGMPVDVIDTVVFRVSMTTVSTLPLFYYGRDRAAADALRAAASTHGLAARMFGATPDVARYVRASDVIVAPTGGPRTAEHLTTAIPVALVGDGAHDHPLARRGAAFAPDSGLSAWIDEMVTGTPPATWRRAVEEAASSFGADVVADAIARSWQARHELATPRTPTEPATSQPAGPFESIGAPSDTPRDETPLSRAAAKEELAAIILEERKLETRIEDAVRERDKWLQRRELAEESGDADLLRVAERRADRWFSEVTALNDKRAKLVDRKERVRKRALAGAAAAAPPPTDQDERWERRFRDLEMKREIERLRRKARGEGD